MSQIVIEKDTVSHSQVKSKIWMGHCLQRWYKEHIGDKYALSINWYGCWSGMGLFIVLVNTELRILNINLFDLNEDYLKTAKELLEYWRCDWSKINTHCLDVNDYFPKILDHNQLFINSACEHFGRDNWLDNLPRNAFVILQATNMPHAQHINPINSLEEFAEKYKFHIRILDKAELEFDYPDKKFSRFMIFGKKR